MSTRKPGRAAKRIAVRIEATVWEQEVGRFATHSDARVAADRERPRVERDGIALEALLACDTVGPDGTYLRGLLKAYVPLAEGPASVRPFGFVFSPERDASGLYLELVAFGERHPRSGVRSVYERAHKRLHGRYPDH